jgi:hypothetical protein
MGIARYLSKLASVLSTDGVVPATKGGTGLASPGASGNLLVSNGTSWTSASGLAGPTGPAGLGFTIAKTYSSVAQLTADTSPTGITPGQFALIDTGDINNAENSRLYVWTGTNYTYTSDLSGAQGIVGPTGPAGTNGIIGVDGAQGPTGPTGPAGAAASGGAAFDAGDVVVSAKASKYTPPTWLPCDGAMYTPGTYPQLDTLYQTPGDYSVTPGIFTEPRDTSNNAVSFYNYVAAVSASVLDPITGDLITFNFNYPAGSRILYIQRASDGRFVYNPNNQLALDVQSDFGSANSITPFFSISPNGQWLLVQKYSGGYLLAIYKRNTQAQETATGNRWIRQFSSTATTSTTAFYGIKISNDGVIIFPTPSTSSYAHAKYDIPSNTLSLGFTVTYNFQASGNVVGYQGIDWHPTMNNYCAVATQTTSYTSGLYYWNGNGLTASGYAVSGQSYTTCAINNAGTGAYFGRGGIVDIYSINTSNGALTFAASITTGLGNTFMISFSQGDAFMCITGGSGIAMYQRTSPGAVTYTATGYGPENYGSYGINNGQWKLVFDPVYNVLVGFGANTTNAVYTVQNWKGTPKTIIPSTPNPGKNLKYYIKTGS